MLKVEVTAGWAKGKIGKLVKQFTEEAFGATWNFVIIEVPHGRKKVEVNLPAGCYKVVGQELTGVKK